MSDTPTDPKYLNMSDDDFLKLTAPEPVVEKTVEEDDAAKAAKAAEDEAARLAAEEAANETTEEEEQETDPDNKDNKDPDNKDTKTDDGDKGTKTEAELKAEEDAKKTPELNADGTPKTPDPKDTSTKKEDEPEVINYEEAYNKILAPFKANGKEIKLNNIDEAIRLMQQGAGYGKKIQQLQPHLKTIRMLEKNNLLDPNKLNNLIDIHQKNPDAIKKLIKESGIDPLDLNTEDNITYIPVNHEVTDSEHSFATALETLQEHPNGQATIVEINSNWDKASKQVLWDSPELLDVIQNQRDIGLYDQIKTEIDRQKLLGLIAPNAPFLQAYKIAGDHLQANNALKPKETLSTTTDLNQPKVLDTRVASPKPKASNGDKALAASPSQATSRKAAEQINPLAMPDDEFLKQFEGRL